ncbi:glycoside hydrolase family 55 protein [Planococcus salinus]|uniref:Pectate lyase n=1 Tax=Planococcus salinus TaxID=1848460 RepID=A0A3M8PB93_9BACL|nr:glycoside hydrolase family 55 protein [Planococcus salinus]RNF40965.1 pectate lyase [Planococcus salinus]
MKLEKTHNPATNEALLAAVLNDPLPLADITMETRRLFEGIKQLPKEQPKSRRKTASEWMWSIFSKPYSIYDDHQYREFIENRQVVPDWKPGLDRQYEKLEKAAGRIVNVKDFGAIGDGLMDCTTAFERAIGTGNVTVFIPPGVYVVKGIRLPSWTRLAGAGKGVSVLKLHDQAAKRQRLVTNLDHAKGNHHISVENLSLDWNVERLGKVRKTATGGTYSSCLTYANVTFGWVKKVEAANPGLHCFDITSPYYNYGGDGRRARSGSRYVWLDETTGHGFGDDGITTHHSDYIFISNSFFCDPSGRSHKRGFSNSNGIEIDDGSRFVWLVNNSTARCFGGVEIKAHAESSAATGVFISGHLSVNDNRSYNFRHIGHHRAGDPQSVSAYNILAQRLVSIAPVFTELYRQSTPRALVVSAYRNVVVNRFLFVGDKQYDYRDNPAAAVQFKARRVVLANGAVTGFKTASSDISIAGGRQGAADVQVRNIHSIQSAEKVVAVGKGNRRTVVEAVRQERSSRG